MRKSILWLLVLCGFIAPVVFAQDTSVNVNTITAPQLASPPVIDGDLSDAAWANVPDVIVNGSGDSPAPTQPGDLDIVMKVAWDDETNALYFAFNIHDDVFVDVLGRGSSVGDGGWNNERMELILNGINTGSASDGENSVFHTQYIFDIPNTIDDSPNGIASIPASTSFISVPVFEGIDGSIQAPGLPFNLNNDYVQSAALIRVTDPNATEWLESPVEWTWEFKIVVFEELTSTGFLGFDEGDPVNIADGFKAFFEDPVNVIHDLQLNDVIGFSPQQNDADVFSTAPEREHQVNTTNRAGNWDSSAELTGLILGARASSVLDWSVQ